MINNIHKYKKSKVIVNDLNKLIEIYNKFLQDINVYKKYVPVANTFHNVNDNLTWLELHLNDQIALVNSKGKE